jgi:hypothetical protein
MTPCSWTDRLLQSIFMECILLCIIWNIYNGTLYTTIILKETKYTILCQHLFLLVVGGQCFYIWPFSTDYIMDLPGSTEVRIVKFVWFIPKPTLQCFTLLPLTYLQPLPLPNFFHASNFSSRATQIVGPKTWPVYFEGTSCPQLQCGRQKKELVDFSKLLVYMYQTTRHHGLNDRIFKFATTRSRASVQVTGLVHLLLYNWFNSTVSKIKDRNIMNRLSELGRMFSFGWIVIVCLVHRSSRPS